MNSHNETYRFGSARWANEDEVRDAGLFAKSGPQIGYWERTPLRFESDAPMLTIGGAGSGKTRDLLAYAVCNSPGQRMAIMDPRGELAAISMIAHAHHREHAYTWNPMRIAGLPSHSCNPLDILDPAALTFHSDCKFIAESLIPLSGSANGHYFELRAREWLEALLKHHVERHGRITLPDLARLIDTIEANPQAWADQLSAMLASAHDSVRRAAGEMLVKQQDSPKEFGAILGEIYAHTSFLSDPVLLPALDGGDFSLSVLTDPAHAVKVFFNVPAEYLGLWSPLIRLFFTVTMLYKSRAPDRPRILLLVDEAGQLGRFEALLRAFTYGRGAGVRAWAIFQDVGQIVRNFDRSALQGFLGSAQMRQFFGVRDYETAELVSSMLGQETLSYDDTLAQGEARMKKQAIAWHLLDGQSPFDIAHEYAHLSKASVHRTKQQRPLMTPDEILSLPEDRQILFVSGHNLPPLLAWKHPYFSRQARCEMAGKFLPNPYHPPTDHIRIPTAIFSRWARVVTEPVPAAFADFPQYREGMWSYVRGWEPRVC
ncbi:type IV secretory system conjugative DNA transfer family protein [Amorphus sp. 3PC139-8]|uniref:type IV secretory system conjugative DNA transfer family protein n=1 Tax=Amorphus sp. 3PC139-8 TaxID=2735676 RepID=UPI00345CFE26